jgi:membrane protein implicated in regulation of membrane protease activity
MAVRTDWTALWIGLGFALMSGCALILWPTQIFLWLGLFAGAVITGGALAHKIGGLYPKIIGCVLGGLLVALLWVFVPRALTPDAMRGKEQLPGFSTYVVFQPNDLNERGRRTYFSFESTEHAKIAFYWAANDVFTLSLLDADGEHYTLEIPLGYDGIPINQFSVVVLEVGVATNYAFMRAVVNGHEVAHQNLVHPNLGDRKWHMATLGGSGPMMWTEQAVRFTTLTDDQINALVANQRQRYGVNK